MGEVVGGLIMTETKSGLPELVVIARAAHMTRDKAMKTNDLRRLRELYGVNLTFCKTAKGQLCK